MRRRLCLSPEALQADLDAWLANVNNERTDQGKMGRGRAPLQTPLAGKKAWNEKVTNLNRSDNRASPGRMSVR